MDEAFWLDRWQSDRIGFHEEEVNPALRAHAPEMPWPDGGRVFVPLCGKSEDMVWLRDHGQHVIGVELSSIACRSFFEEHDEDYVLQDAGAHRRYVGDEIEIFCGDYFALSAERLGPVDGVYDRAALVALPEAMRARYVEQMAALVPAGVSILLQTVEYDQSELDGPPFSVDEAEVRARYAQAFEIELIEEGEWSEPPENFAARGMSRVRQHCFSLQRTPA